MLTTRKIALITYTVCIALTVWGCSDDDDNSGGDGSVESRTPTARGACEKLIKYCATEPVWSDYISSVGQCQDMFECISDLYTGSCRSRVSTLLKCGEEIESGEQCEPCTEIAYKLSEDCPYPEGCM
ncbi:MAG: hypothetical protein JXA30_02330 [Deltaproteobacteria bacterium]|nr:hypothetical protein [Deltaproteobacteria bacterium]